MTVDAKQEAIGFYEKHGFAVVEKTRSKNELSLYLNIPPIVEKMKPTESFDILD